MNALRVAQKLVLLDVIPDVAQHAILIVQIAALADVMRRASVDVVKAVRVHAKMAAPENAKKVVTVHVSAHVQDVRDVPDALVCAKLIAKVDVRISVKEIVEICVRAVALMNALVVTRNVKGVMAHARAHATKLVLSRAAHHVMMDAQDRAWMHVSAHVMINVKIIAKPGVILHA